MRLRILKVLLLVCLIGVHNSARAQQPNAAVIEILYPGVELKRADTGDWLKLVVNSQSPLGAGDSLRTNDDGRALISFSTAAQTLLLPKSEYTILNFEQNSDNTYDIEARLLQGRSIQRLLSADTVATYQLQTEHITVSQPAALFALQVEPGLASAVIVGSGSALIATPDAEISLATGEGLQAAPTPGEVITLAAPYRFSFLSVTAEVCLGVVQATLPNTDSVVVRAGPGENYPRLGKIPNGAQIAILGMIENGKRYRIPFLSGFGWVITNGVIPQNCDDLPILPGTAETVNSIRNAQPLELAFLQPFFGSPEEDTWYYIYD
jgi:hypothetical protein